jgi:glc operon protein GlcG
MRIANVKTPFQVLVSFVALSAAVFSCLAESPLGDKKTLTLDTAKKITDVAEKLAASKKWKMAIAIMDDGGNLLYLERMDGAPLSAVEIAQEKARTAVMFQKPTDDFSTRLKNGTTGLLKLPVIPFKGGMPISFNGQVVGGIGVSGVTEDEDGQVAKAGADWSTTYLK